MSQVHSQDTQSEQFACSVQYNEVYVWGNNSFGQLGLGALAFGQSQASDAGGASNSKRSDGRASVEKFTNDESHQVMLPKICCFNTVVRKVSCGMSHAIMLSASGHVYAMGSNQYG